MEEKKTTKPTNQKVEKVKKEKKLYTVHAHPHPLVSKRLFETKCGVCLSSLTEVWGYRCYNQGCGWEVCSLCFEKNPKPPVMAAKRMGAKMFHPSNGRNLFELPPPFSPNTKTMVTPAIIAVMKERFESLQTENKKEEECLEVIAEEFGFAQQQKHHIVTLLL